MHRRGWLVAPRPPPVHASSRLMARHSPADASGGRASLRARMDRSSHEPECDRTHRARQTMKRWTEFVLVACAAGVALAQWVVPATMQGILSVLLLALVALTVFSQRNALQLTIGSLNAAHLEQLESERRYRALFDACSDAILVYRLEDDGRPGQLVEVNEAACRSLSYSRKELLAMSADEVHAPEARRNVQELSQALSEAGTLSLIHISEPTRQAEI